MTNLCFCAHVFPDHLQQFTSRGRPPPTFDPHSCNVRARACVAGVLLHIMADTLGSVGVIISALLMQKYDLMIADPICSILIALLIAIR